jgi:hypothetical protein
MIGEIEAAIERLSAEQVEELVRWLSALRARAGKEGTATDELESLAGTWQEDAAFDAAVLAFEQVDEALWQ